MKKQLIAIASVAMLAGVFTFSSCKKEDTTAPSLTITGGNAQTQSLPATAGNGTYTYPTVTATDDVDGDLTTSVTYTGTVDANLAGNYELIYTVSDAAGNSATETVTVSIVNDAANFAGTHNCLDTVFPTGTYFGNYNQTIAASTTENNKIVFSRFGDYSGNTTIYAIVNGTVVTMASQTTGLIGSNSHIHTFSGSGTASGNNMIINYTDTDVTASATASGVVHFTHQ